MSVVYHAFFRATEMPFHAAFAVKYGGKVDRGAETLASAMVVRRWPRCQPTQGDRATQRWKTVTIMKCFRGNRHDMECAECLACVSQSPQTPRPSKRALLICRISWVRLAVRLHLAKSLQTDWGQRNARGATSPRAN